jgi:hypothetical protein
MRETGSEASYRISIAEEEQKSFELTRQQLQLADSAFGIHAEESDPRL